MGEIEEKAKPVVLHIKLDPDKHRAFKIAAVRANLTMQHAVELLIDKAITQKETLNDLKKSSK